MTFALTAEQLEIRDAVARLCQRFGDDYWLKKDRDGGFPENATVIRAVRERLGG